MCYIATMYVVSKRSLCQDTETTLTSYWPSVNTDNLLTSYIAMFSTIGQSLTERSFLNASLFHIMLYPSLTCFNTCKSCIRFYRQSHLCGIPTCWLLSTWKNNMKAPYFNKLIIFQQLL